MILKQYSIMVSTVAFEANSIGSIPITAGRPHIGSNPIEAVVIISGLALGN